MATDAEIRAAGLYAVPNRQFLQDEFQLPDNTPTETEEVTESFGIPNTNAFTNSGGGGGGSFNNNGFQQAVDARQNRLNAPIDTSTFMGKAKDFIEPQSASQIMTDGYQEPRFQPGIIGTMLGKIDNYRNLPQADQAFIAQNMGYTGPTVFGENNSGLGKDMYGINTRSLFGNYANYVDEMEADYSKIDKAAYAKLSKFQQKKVDFYRGKKKESDALKMQEELAEEERKAGIQNIQQRIDKEYKDSGGGGFNKSNDPTGSKEKGFNMHGDGKMANGGRAGYFFGGRVNYKAGGRTNYVRGGAAQDMGNAENQAASAAAAGTSTSAPGPGDTGGEGGNNPSDDSDTQFGGGNNGDGVKPKTNIFTNTGNLLNIPTQFLQSLVGNPFNRRGGFLTKAGLTKSQEEELEDIANKKGGFKGSITNTDYGMPTNTFELNKDMTPTQISNATTFGQGSYTKDPTTGKTSLDGGNYDFDGKFGAVGDFVDAGGITGAVDRFGSNLYEDQVNNPDMNYLAKGGRAMFKNGGLASIL